ncbi:RNA polymerase sigma factor (sigma-70 family) [Thermonema lapsum]|jgi:RNA polymerase sigma factor (sigma-70 family)|uniref:RNA polymerase sigma factor (Sigma-70 family) n=1 Tax=Thermonema lapsum TaxID=28195 RepID=A0A846MS12_9BACT|nr:sigma-70 family RNA polymerase sigma factor [Thermonema lapsum]NIK74376.1 RNA polymerase sigma factor (sigma-70 family) [Thermonema lapsum]
MPIQFSTDEQLLEGIRKGDTSAILQLYKTSYHSVEHFILQNSGSEADAQDIFQEALVVLCEKVSNPHFMLTASLNTYLYSICRRMWLKHLRDTKRHLDVEDFREFIPMDEDSEDWETMELQQQAMHRAMEELGSPCKELLKAYYFEHRSMQEIADAFGYTNANNAKTQKYKCLQRLKRYFFKESHTHKT